MNDSKIVDATGCNRLEKCYEMIGNHTVTSVTQNTENAFYCVIYSSRIRFQQTN